MNFKDTEIGRIPFEWDVRMIQDVAEVVSGATPKTKVAEYWDGNIAWITPKDLSNHTERYIYRGDRMITDEGLKNSSAKLLPKGSVLFSSRAPIGYTAIAAQELCTNQGFKSMICNQQILDNNFMFYMMNYKKNEIENIAGGSTFKEVSGKTVKEFKIPIPPLDEQKAIAKVLSDLDEKIEINNKINKKLEEMAQAIFKQWFVDFEFPNEDGKPYKSSGGEMVESELGMIPKGWQIKKIKDLPLNVTDYVANGSFKSLKDNVTLYDEENYALYIRNTDLKAKFSSDRKYVDKSSYEFLQKTKLFGYEVIISNVGDVGSVYLCPVFDMPMTLGSNVIMINTLENNIDLNIFVFRMFKSFIGQHLIDSITGGSAQPKFNKTDFRNMDLIIPSEDLLEKYNQVAKNIESLILFNDVENKKVGIIRDTLLPKLMSGEIRVPID